MEKITEKYKYKNFTKMGNSMIQCCEDRTKTTKMFKGICQSVISNIIYASDQFFSLKLVVKV